MKMVIFHFLRFCNFFWQIFCQKCTALRRSSIKNINSRVKLNFKEPQKNLLRIKMRYITSLWLKQFRRYSKKYENSNFPFFFGKFSVDHLKFKIRKSYEHLMNKDYAMFTRYDQYQPYFDHCQSYVTISSKLDL